MAGTRLVTSDREYLSNSGVPNCNAAYTWSSWVFFARGNSYVVEIGSTSNYDVIHLDTDERLVLYSYDDGTPESASGSISGLAGWHHVALVRDGTDDNDLSIYLDFVLEATITNGPGDVGDRAAPTRYELGQSFQAADTGNEGYAGAKMYEYALTIAEIQHEALQYRAIRPAWGEWDFINGNLLDKSGNGNDFTETGTPDAMPEGPGIAIVGQGVTVYHPRTSGPALPVVTTSEMDPAKFVEGDEWFAVIDGSGADTPSVRVSITFRLDE